MLIEITDPSDVRLADYTQLTDVALRKRLETANGLYMAESTKVITRAVAAGHEPRSFLMTRRWLEDMRPVIAAAKGTGGDPLGGDKPVFVGDDAVVEGLTGFHLHRGALAEMNRPQLPSVAQVLAGARGLGVWRCWKTWLTTLMWGQFSVALPPWGLTQCWLALHARIRFTAVACGYLWERFSRCPGPV